MINNTMMLAKKQLEMHSKMGEKSSLSIFEVAKLMDTLNEMEQMKSSDLHQNHLFFGFSAN